jgi:hypothetical protein
MILISHRGNINGKKETMENHPEYVLTALNLGFDVEIDLWYSNETFFLGHDEPKYEITQDWLVLYSEKLWLHCKNLEAIEYFKNNNLNLNYFWHQEDFVTITSKGHIWTYPGKQPIKNSIAVLPEKYNDPIYSCYGICSDYPHKFLKKNKWN